MPAAGLVDALLAESRFAELDLARLGLAWARVLPTALFLPAFGLGFLALPVRAVIAVGLAVAILPAMPLPTAAPLGEPWLLAVFSGFARGVPVALVASVSVWAAMIAGGVADTAVGTARFRPAPGALGPRATPLATLLGLLASVAFFETGGAGRVLTSLMDDGVTGLDAAVGDLAAGLGLGVAIGGPFLVVGLVVDVATAMATRERPLALTEGQLAPLRALVLLVASAALFERVAEAIVVFGSSRP